MSKEKRKRDKEMRRLSSPKFTENRIERYGLVVEPRKTRRREGRIVLRRGKQDLPIFRNEQVKANEHLLTGAYTDVRDRNKAEFNAEMRSL